MMNGWGGMDGGGWLVVLLSIVVVAAVIVGVVFLVRGLGTGGTGAGRCKPARKSPRRTSSSGATLRGLNRPRSSDAGRQGETQRLFRVSAAFLPPADAGSMSTAFWNSAFACASSDAALACCPFCCAACEAVWR